MKNLQNVEVFFIEEPKNGDMFAWISYRDPDYKGDDPTNGNSHIRVPVNLRPIQKSSRDNILVDQSEKNYVEAAAVNPPTQNEN